MSLQRTPLYEAHRALEAKLVDFGGWDMPLHYGSQLSEHQAVRSRAGMFDVSHMLAVDISGDQALPFLQRLLANDAGRLSPGKALYSCMLNEDGGILDDLIVYRLPREGYRVVVNAATADKDLRWMRSRLQGGAALVPRRDLAIIAVQGPQARELAWRALPGIREASEALPAFGAAEAEDIFVARTGYTGEDGFELMLDAKAAPGAWQALLDAGVRPAGLGARDTLRLEAGMNLYGQDMDERVMPAECGLEWTVDLHGERDFIGRQALVAARPRARMLGLVLLDRGVLRAHQPVETAQGAGITTSGTYSPTLLASIALARVPPGTAAGAAVKVQVRDKWLAARTVKSPFVRHGRSLLPELPAAP